MKQRTGVRKDAPPEPGFRTVSSTSISSASAQPLPWDPCVQVGPGLGQTELFPWGVGQVWRAHVPNAGGSGPGGVFSEGWQGCRISQMWNQLSPYEPWAAPGCPAGSRGSSRSKCIPTAATWPYCVPGPVLRVCAPQIASVLTETQRQTRPPDTSYCDRKEGGRTMFLPVCLLPVAAVTNDHKRGGLKQHECIFLQLQASEGHNGLQPRSRRLSGGVWSCLAWFPGASRLHQEGWLSLSPASH